MINFTDVNTRFNKIIDLYTNDIGSIRTGRATSALIENVVVAISTYGGQKMRLVELGSIGVPDARTLTFQPWDMGAIREIANGIQAANIGLTPAVDGQIIRMSLPMMTREQREEFVKLLGRKSEGAKNMGRDARSDFRKKLMDAKNAKEIGEDEFKRDEEQLQKATDEFVKKIEEIEKKKEVEIRG